MRIREESRSPALRIFDDEVIIDLFAGGGGWSLGIEQALGRSPDAAVNHDPDAVAMHKVNHPETEHYIEDIYDVNPTMVCRGKRCGLLVMSPDCTEHSRAKNGAIVRDRKVRSLADVVHRWVAEVRPRVIFLENVDEWKDWGPLDEHGKIIKDRKGELFQLWWTRLERAGYRLSTRLLCAADFGAPTSRKRRFVIAIDQSQWEVDPETLWPEATHGPGRAQPWRTAAECIDYTEECPSIFMNKRQARAYTRRTGIRCKRPLVKTTMRRIRRGLWKYVLKNARPFIVPVSHAAKSETEARVHDTDEAFRTVTGANRGELALVQPYVARYNGDVEGAERTAQLDMPLSTADTSNRFALVTPYVARYNGQSVGQDTAEPLTTVDCNDRFAVVTPYVARTDMHQSNAGCAYDANDPLRTQCTGGSFAVVAPMVVPVKSWGGGGNDAAPANKAHRTITTSKRGEFAIVAPTLIQTGYGERPGQAPRCLDITKPLGAVISGGTGGNGKHAIVETRIAAFISKGFSEQQGGFNGASSIDTPLHTITQRDHNNLALSWMTKLRGTSDAHMDASSMPLETPVPTISAGGNHIAEVRAFLAKQCDDAVDDPELRAGILRIDGARYQITDIGMRMFKARELFRAQGFPDSYIIDPVTTRTLTWTRNGKTYRRQVTGPLTETIQIEKCGNSVPPPVACAIVRSVFAATYAERSVAA